MDNEEPNNFGVIRISKDEPNTPQSPPLPVVPDAPQPKAVEEFDAERYASIGTISLNETPDQKAARLKATKDDQGLVFPAIMFPSEWLFWVIQNSDGFIVDRNKAGYGILGIIVFLVTALVVPFFLFAEVASTTLYAPKGSIIIYSSSTPPHLDKPKFQ